MTCRTRPSSELGLRGIARQSLSSIATVLAAACGAPSPSTNAVAPLRSAGTAQASASPTSALPAPTPDRAPLGATKLVPLDVSLVAIQGSKRVFAIADYANQPSLFAQLVGEDGLVGPVISLRNAHWVGAFETKANLITLVTSELGKLCMRTLSDSKLGPATCFDADADVVVGLGERLVLLGARNPLPEEDELQPAKKPKPSAQPKPKPPSKPKTKAKTKSKPTTQEEAKRRLFESGKEVELLATFVEADGTRADVETTGLKFREAMAGMALIGAGARNDRVDLLFYEHADKKGKEPRAKLGVAQLDKDGKHDEKARKSINESRLEAGFLADHSDMRLLTLDEGSIALGTRGPHGKCDVTITAPYVMQMIPAQDDCAIDPQRFFPVAYARRKGGEPDLPDPTTIAPEKTYRAFGQPTWDVGRSIYSQGHAWAFEGNRLVYWGGTLQAVEVARPLQAEQNRIRWGTFAADGSGVAQTDEGLVFVSASGALTKSAGVELRRLGGPDRDDVAAVQRRVVAKIGPSIFQARGELRKLAPDLASGTRSLAPDTALLVGGKQSGMLLEVSPPGLAVSELAADGALKALGRTVSAVGPGFDAVERAAGGAIVVGPALRDPKRVVSFVVDGAGAVSPARDIALPLGKGDGPAFVRLAPLPNGGALLFDARRTRVAWLDDDGNELARAELPNVAVDSGCIDGRPAPDKVPSATPGELVEFKPAATPGTCLVGEIGYRADGTLLWFGSTTAGPHTRADFGTMSASAQTATQAKPETKLAKAKPLEAPRCPSEMVFVPPDLCVDRFEGALLDDTSGRYLSSDYPATPNLLAAVLGEFSTKRERMGDVFARSLPLPYVSTWQRTTSLAPMATSLLGVRPSGYVTGLLAKSACELAQKRLCKPEEWKKACRGEADTIYPYGTTFSKATCNVNGQIHPGVLLHENASILHLDPRLNRVEVERAPLLHRTGASPDCKSRWGDDAIFDMVGNLDEWVDEKGGGFAGGFYARNTTNGCEALITAHPPGYLDYSTGIRCCRAAD